MLTPTEYRRRLLHFQPENVVFFITFRLTNTLPKELIESLNHQLELENNSLKAKQNYFEEIEAFLDKAKAGPTWLKQK